MPWVHNLYSIVVIINAALGLQGSDVGVFNGNLVANLFLSRNTIVLVGLNVDAALRSNTLGFFDTRTLPELRCCISAVEKANQKAE